MSNTIDGTFFLRSTKQINMYWVWIAVGAIGILFSLFINAGMSSLGILLIVGIIMIVNKDKPVLTFHDTWFELKAAPLAPVIMVHYKDISDVAKDEKKLVITVTSRPKPLKLFLAGFNVEDHQSIEQAFRTALAMHE